MCLFSTITVRLYIQSFCAKIEFGNEPDACVTPSIIKDGIGIDGFDGPTKFPLYPPICVPTSLTSWNKGTP